MNETDIQAAVDDMLAELMQEGIAGSGDYIDADTGLLMCGKCRTKKQTVVKQIGRTISSHTFFRLSLRPFRAVLIASPKALKSYRGTGLFAIFIHPITFYCSPFFLDMSTQYLSIA